MSKFKSGDVVLNTSTHLVHLYLTDTTFVHIVHEMSTKAGYVDTSVFPIVYNSSRDTDRKHKLLFNIGQFLASHLKYEKTTHTPRPEKLFKIGS